MIEKNSFSNFQADFAAVASRVSYSESRIVFLRLSRHWAKFRAREKLVDQDKRYPPYPDVMDQQPLLNSDGRDSGQDDAHPDTKGAGDLLRQVQEDGRAPDALRAMRRAAAATDQAGRPPLLQPEAAADPQLLPIPPIPPSRPEAHWKGATLCPSAVSKRAPICTDRPEKDTYKLLIDAYRLRLNDVAMIEGVVEPDSVYASATNDPLPGFRRFLDKASATTGGLLPPWWSADKQRECEDLGMSSATGDGWTSLRKKIQKGDVTDHYGDAKFPMQLRMLAEAVYNRGLGGQGGSTTMSHDRD
ncbi:hypothetical protein DL770_006450 [Monosporascus sp. CRB-9-2]|nr:hypothetical protein DL770_006450 [Monosporascus sp. CRB-9-2]